MKLFRILFVVTLFSFLIVGCNEEIGDKNRKIKTTDGRFTLYFVNKDGYSDETIDNMEKKLIYHYEGIVTKYGEPTTNQSHIFVNLLKDNNVSHVSGPGSINLYHVDSVENALVHELVHIFYPSENQESFSYLTLEGLAVTIASENGEHKSYPYYGVPFHKVMNYLIFKDVYIPLEDLIEVNRSKEIMYQKIASKEVKIRQWVAYTEAGSFTKYLIDHYGVEKFMEIYGKSNLEGSIKEVYGKSSSEMAKEWLEFVSQKQNAFTLIDRIKHAIPINGFRMNANGFVYE